MSESISKPSESTQNRITIEREKWSGSLDFLLSCIGYAVGMGNIWRFPYLCYKNGGGSFLIPYIFFMFIGALPMFFIEYAISQFSSRGPITVWKICPLMKGLGYGMVIVSAMVSIYFNIMMAWVLYFLYQSFTTVLPWSTCDNDWNTKYCFVNDQSNVSHLNPTSFAENSSTTPSEEFWRHSVLQISGGIDKMGKIRLELLLCLFLSWLLLFGCLCRGIKVSGKIVYVTATFPYLVLIIFLVRGVTLPGSYDGLKFYLIPQWDKLLSTKVWGEAALQIFFSSSMGWGGLHMFASYNKFNHNIKRDSILIPAINCGTSIFSGLVTFSILGFMAKEKGMTVDEVLTQGPDLVFMAYPEAISRLPISPLWSVLFFLMLLTTGIDSLFGMIETITCALIDEFPKFLRHRRLLLTGGICLVDFVLGIPFVMQGGIYFLQIVDWYCGLFSIMIICIFESIIIGWIYGLERFNRDIEMMVGKKPCFWWNICWKYITPVLLVAMVVFNMTQIQPVSYGTYEYPTWAIALGWIIGMVSVLPIPIYVAIALSRSKGTLLERIKNKLEPDPDWGPALDVNKEEAKDMMQLNSTIKDDSTCLSETENVI